MRKTQRKFLTVFGFIGIISAIIILNIVDQQNILGGNFTVMVNNSISLVPQLFGIVLGIISLNRDYGNRTLYASIVIMGLLGIFISSLFYELNNMGIWIDELITASFTITDLQFVVILWALILGFMVGMIKK